MGGYKRQRALWPVPWVSGTQGRAARVKKRRKTCQGFPGLVAQGEANRHMGQHQHGDAGGQVGVALLVVHTAVGGFAVVGKELFQPCRMVVVAVHVGVVGVLVRVVHPVARQHAVHQPQRGCHT